MNGKEIKTKGVARKTGRADFRAVKAPCLWASAQPEISLREEINFLPGENKFLCGRKNISLREKINLYTGRNKFPCGRKFTGIREKILRLAIISDCYCEPLE